MKNNFIKTIFMSMLLVVAIGCEESDDTRFVESPDFGWVEFANASTTVAVNSETTSIPVTVVFTAPINRSNLAVNYNVRNVAGDASAAVSGSGRLIIDKDTNRADITLNVLSTAANALLNGDISFDLNLTSASRGVDVGLSDGSSTVTHRVNLVCDVQLPLGGMYSVTTNYGYHDFLPSFNPNTMDMEIVDNGDGTFFVQDFSGGLYNGGPYTTAYGTGPTSFDFTFSNACTQIVWSNQDDGYGAVIPLAGGTNEYDPATGVVTTSWFCEGYGENGVSVYTPK